MAKITEHSPGVVSVDTTDMTADTSTIEFMKNSKLYGTMVQTLGEGNAAEVVENASGQQGSFIGAATRTFRTYLARHK